MTGGFWRVWYWAAALSLAPTLLFSYRNLWVVALCLWVPVAWKALRRPRDWLPPPSWSWPLLALVLWGVVSVLWSPSPRAMESAAGLLLLSLVSMQMLGMPPPRARMFAAGVALALAFLAIDATSGGAIRTAVPPDQPPLKDAVATAKGLSLCFMMIPPLVLWMTRVAGFSRFRGVPFIAGMAAAALPVLANVAALVTAFVAFLVTSLRPVFGLRMMVAAWGIILLSPVLMMATVPGVDRALAMTRLPDSAVHRLVIWRSVIGAWWEEGGLFGAGARASAELTERLGDVTLASGVTVPRVSVQPHNMPLEILYELGLFGYALLLTGGLMAGHALLRHRWAPGMATAIATLLAISAVFVSVDPSVWHVHVISAPILSALALRAVARDHPR